MVSTGLPPILIERLGGDHAKIAGVVRALEALVDTLEAQPDWAQLADLLSFLEYFADRVHHPLEDRLFDLVVNKGLTPTERHLVFRNLGQHREIKALTEALTRQVREAQAGRPVDPGDFRESLAEYVALQRRHMRFEESHLFPLLEGALDNRDWNVLTGILQEAPFAQGDEESR
ncbi:MAG: hemerythrin domain-containing protein [Pseudomonadales bacterium]